MNQFHAGRTRRAALAGGLALAGAGAAAGGAMGGEGSGVQLYANGDILTMEGDHPQRVEALATRDGRIVFAGPAAEAARRFPGAERIDLAGRTLLPGFIDGHSHIYMTGLMALMANHYPPPDGPAVDFAEIVAGTRRWMETPDGRLMISRLGWVVGRGYDDAQLAERRHPTREVLDQISRDLPVMIIHQSGHLACVNTKALEVAGLTRDTPDPPGGVIRRGPDGVPNGVLEEAAYVRLAFRVTGHTGADVQGRILERAQEMYASTGYTTAQDGRSTKDVTDALAELAQAGALKLDVVSYPDITFNSGAVVPPWRSADRAYRAHYRIGGVKLSLDGSPQGKTAWLSAPYLEPPEGQKAGYLGYGSMPDAAAEHFVDLAFQNRWQLLVHANGDAAIDQLLRAVDKAIAAHGYPDHRTVLVHGQTLRKDQIPELKRLGMLPSLFPLHTYYWGDWHASSVLGSPRADYISPCRDVLKAGLTLTSHHDAPVTLPDALRVLDATVNRTTRSGRVLGPDQRLTPYEGLKTLTHWAAIQYFEEADKGTLTVGKRADLVILDKNPLKVPPADLHRIAVVRTIKDGRTVYVKSAA